MLGRGTIAFAIALVVSLAGCIDAHRADAVWVKNETATDLHFEIVRPNGELFALPRPTIRRGETDYVLDYGQLTTGGLGANGCTTGDLIARAPDESEMSRHPAGLCVRQTWTITSAPSPPSSSSPTS